MRIVRPFAGAVARVRWLWDGLVRRREVETEIDEEFRHHLALRTEDLMRRGLSPRGASRRARLEFGHVESHREDARASRGLHLFDQAGFSWLDVKLGVRMLAKYPGLSLVSVIGMSVGIAIGGGGFGLVHAIVDAPLPLDEGERVVSLQNSDARTPGNADRHAAYDFVMWREALRSVRELSAFTDEDVILRIPGGVTVPVVAARMTASGFRVARVAPVLGRTLLEDDEHVGAAPVVVIAWDEWQRRFGADPEIIGRQVRLDGIGHTVVGVMPEGFRFPVNHRYWTPLRLEPMASEVGAGPQILMFGRLAEGATLERAQAELTAVGRRMAAAYPATHEHLRPVVRPYTHPFIGIDSPARAWLIRSLQIGLSLLLVVVSVNVAILVYARTAARTAEIAVRTALGASRGRVVRQLFAEALVLSLVAAAIGLGIAALGMRLIRDLLSREDIPFWVDFRLTSPVIVYVAGLAVLAAVIVGVVPALRATGSALHGTLQRISSRGARMRLGRVWTALIVVQVAVAVGALPYAISAGSQLVRSGTTEPDYPIDEFLHATLSLDAEAVAGPRTSATDDAARARLADGVEELVRRLEADPAVAGVTLASRFPGQESDAVSIEVEGVPARRWGWINRVGTELFDVFDQPVLAGRSFGPADEAPGSNAVLVDRALAELVPGSRGLLGRRVREWRRRTGGSGEMDPGPWLEIVGVVPSFTPPRFERPAPRLYRPLTRADIEGAVQLAIRMKPGAAPATFLGRVREIAQAADSRLRLDELQTASEAERILRKSFLSLALAIVAITGSVLLLSAAGIYAMMSFTVASRRREIGIRAALGASPGLVLRSVLARAGKQLAAGAMAGPLLAEAVPRMSGGSFFAGDGIVMVPVVVTIMLAIGLLAAFGPARRGLSIQPTEALREE